MNSSSSSLSDSLVSYYTNFNIFKDGIASDNLLCSQSYFYYSISKENLSLFFLFEFNTFRFFGLIFTKYFLINFLS